MSYRGQVWVPPSNTSFTNRNFSGLAAATTVGSSIAMVTTPAANDNLVGQTIAAPSTPYCIIASVACNQGDYVSTGYTTPRTNLFGLGFYDGTKAIVGMAAFANNATMRYDVYEWTNVSTINTAVFGQSYASGQPTANLQWFQVRDDGTNIYFYVAMDGGQTQPTHWVKTYQQARTSYLANVNNVGWFGYTGNLNTGQPNYYTLNSWQAVAL
jgi:hypothetical protein